jgi:hypothetical protein
VIYQQPAGSPAESRSTVIVRRQSGRRSGEPPPFTRLVVEGRSEAWLAILLTAEC